MASWFPARVHSIAWLLQRQHLSSQASCTAWAGRRHPESCWAAHGQQVQAVLCWRKQAGHLVSQLWVFTDPGQPLGITGKEQVFVCTHNSGGESPESRGMTPLSPSLGNAGCLQPHWITGKGALTHPSSSPGHASSVLLLLTLASGPPHAGARLDPRQRTGNSRLQEVVEKLSS